MTDQTPINNTPPEQQEPFIPPQVMLIVSGIGFLVALIVAFTQPTFTVVGFGGLGLGILALVMWALLAPQQFIALFTGRAVRFGGLSIVVTVIVLTAFVMLYIFVRNQNIRLDLTESDLFSLTVESRDAITAFGADPNIPQVRMIAFYDSTQAGRRDQDSLLFEEYQEASGGKITYEFINPDQLPNLANAFGITRAGQVAVVAAADAEAIAASQAATDPAADPTAVEEAPSVITLEDGFAADVENAEIVQTPIQEQLTNAILKVAAAGDFNAYFLTVQNSVSSEMATLKTNLTNRFDWNIQEISLVELASPQGEFTLNDPNLDGEVIIIPGGDTPLGEAELEILQNYLNAGGDLVIFADTNLNAAGVSLATDPALNEFLLANFGIAFNNDVIIDETQAFQSPLLPVATDFDRSTFITTNGINPTQPVAVFEVPHSITVAETPPANVTVTELVRSTDQAYQRTDIETLIAEESVTRPEDAVQQAFVLAATAENTQTGAKIVLFGSISPARDVYSQLNVDNLGLAFNSLIYATDYNNFFTQITVLQPQRPQDSPIFADQQTIGTINFLTLGALPFGILALGVIVWLSNRERRRTT